MAETPSGLWVPTTEEGNVTAIVIDYETGTEDPGRVFRSMAHLVDSFTGVDQHLARAVTVQIHPVQLLQDIEVGSLKTLIRTVLRQFDDDALKNLDWKPMIGQYLVRAKHRLLIWLDGHDGVRDIADIEPLRDELLELARSTDVLQLPAYTKVPHQELLTDMQKISEAMTDLQSGDSAKFIGNDDETEIRPRFQLSSGEIEDLLTVEVETSHSELVLQVKKPDYLGTSMWEVRHEGHTVQAKIVDEPWLERFHEREIIIRPRDAIRAQVDIEIKRAADGSVVASRYVVLKVLEVIDADDTDQLDFLSSED